MKVKASFVKAMLVALVAAGYHGGAAAGEAPPTAKSNFFKPHHDARTREPKGDVPPGLPPDAHAPPNPGMDPMANLPSSGGSSAGAENRFVGRINGVLAYRTNGNYRFTNPAETPVESRQP